MSDANIQANSSVGRVTLAPTCTIHEIAALKDHLLQQQSNGGPIEIDGGAVQRIDTAGLQLVLAFALDCLDRNVEYRWVARSSQLEDAIQTLGIAALLESPGASNFPIKAA